jgi:hypothetical protein
MDGVLPDNRNIVRKARRMCPAQVRKHAIVSYRLVGLHDADALTRSACPSRVLVLYHPHLYPVSEIILFLKFKLYSSM